MRQKKWKILSIILAYFLTIMWAAYPLISEYEIPKDKFYYAQYAPGEFFI